MRTLLWRAVEALLRPHLTSDQLACTIGDLAEDLERIDRSRGRLAGSLWLAREALSVSAAYRARQRQDRRRSWRSLMGRSWLDDIRFARRRLVRQPAASLAAMAALGCAIAAAAVTWSLLSALILDPLPVRSPDRLFVVGSHRAASGATPETIEELNVYTVHRDVGESGAFAEAAAIAGASMLVHDPGAAAPRERRLAFISHDFFETLGIQPSVGREFDPEDDRRNAPLTAVVSHRYWRTALGSDAGVLGRAIAVAGTPATIIGVVPRPFLGVDLAAPPDVYLPLLGVASLDPQALPANPLNDPVRVTPTAWVKTIGRLAPGATAAQVQQQLDALPEDVRRGRRLELVPLAATVLPPPAREPMRRFGTLLAATVALLLLIGCATAGVLLLVRTEARRDELAVCLALGGTRLSLARGIVFEGALVALAGVALAVPCAWWLFSLLRAFQLPGAIDIARLELTVDRASWLAIAACGAAAVLLIALIAAAFGSAPSETSVLQSRVSATPRVTRRRTRSALVIVQVAVALVLVAGAGQLIRSLVAALSLNPGFDASRVITGDVQLRTHGYSTAQADPFFDELRERLSSHASIESVSFLQWRGAMTPSGQMIVDGRPKQFAATVAFFAVDDRYFPTVGLPIVAGRDFSADDTLGSPRVAVVSESFARRVADGADPLGHTIYDFYTSASVEIVGVVPDVITNVAQLEPLSIYFPAAQLELYPWRTLVVRAADAAWAAREATAAIAALDPQVTPAPLLTIRERLALQMGAQRLGSLVLGAFGAIAVLLTLLGAFVLADATSTSRRREFGIRAALGASRAALGGLIVGETLTLVGCGLVLGLGLAWLGAGLIGAFLFQVEALDLLSLTATSGGMLVLAAAASLRPALDAMRVDLAQLLRDE